MSVANPSTATTDRAAPNPTSDPIDRRVAQILSGLDTVDVTWALLREPDRTTEPLEFDVLIAAGRHRQAEALLRESGFRRSRAWGRRPHRFHIGEIDGVVVKLDLVDRCSFGALHEYDLPVAAAVLARRRVDHDGWCTPHPADRAWLHLLHALLDKGVLSQRAREAVAPVATSSDSVVVDPLPVDLVGDLVDAVDAGCWDDVLAASPRLRGALLEHDPQAPRRARRQRRLRRANKLQRMVLRPAARVAVLGPDGAGKTTVIGDLASTGAFGRTEYLGVAPRRSRADGSPVPTTFGRTLLRLWAAWIRGAVSARRGRNVLLDRHPMEAVYGPPTGSRRTRLRRWLLAHAVPRPDVLIVLDAPAEVLHARKPEHSVDEAARRRARCLALAADHGAVVIDTTAGRDLVAAEIESLVHHRRLLARRPARRSATGQARP